MAAEDMAEIGMRRDSWPRSTDIYTDFSRGGTDFLWKKWEGFRTRRKSWKTAVPAVREESASRQSSLGFLFGVILLPLIQRWIVGADMSGCLQAATVRIRGRGFPGGVFCSGSVSFHDVLFAPIPLALAAGCTTIRRFPSTAADEPHLR